MDTSQHSLECTNEGSKECCLNVREDFVTGREEAATSLFTSEVSLPVSAKSYNQQSTPGLLVPTIVHKSVSQPLASGLIIARHIQDVYQVPYPEGIKRPELELNSNTNNGKFRYDRNFLLQFMPICKEKPDNLPPLKAFGLEPYDWSHTVAHSICSRCSSTVPTQVSVDLGIDGLNYFGSKPGSGSYMNKFGTPPIKLLSEEQFMCQTSICSEPGGLTNKGLSTSVTNPAGPLSKNNAWAKGSPPSSTSTSSAPSPRPQSPATNPSQATSQTHSRRSSQHANFKDAVGVEIASGSRGNVPPRTTTDPINFGTVNGSVNDKFTATSATSPALAPFVSKTESRQPVQSFGSIEATQSSMPTTAKPSVSSASSSVASASSATSISTTTSATTPHNQAPKFIRLIICLSAT